MEVAARVAAVNLAAEAAVAASAEEVCLVVYSVAVAKAAAR